MILPVISPEALTALTHPIHAARQAFGDLALNARDTIAKVHWLRAEADLVNQAVMPVSPCRTGCSHCCYQGLAIARGEAEVIARELGRELAEPPAERKVVAADLVALGGEEAIEQLRQRTALIRSTYGGVACVFLQDGRCSIYAHRPVACRLHISLADSGEPCRIVRGEEPVSVPYVNVEQERDLYILALGRQSIELADIRDWFPSEGTS